MSKIEPAKEQRERLAFRHYVVSELVFVFGVLASLVLPALLFLAISPPIVFRVRSLLFIIPVLIELITLVGFRVAELTGRKNRDLMTLKEQLTGIYLSALKKSALNPKLESLTPHD